MFAAAASPSHRHGPLSAALLLTLALVLGVARAELAPEQTALAARVHQRYGAHTAAQVEAWLDLHNEMLGAERSQQLERINSFFNRRLQFADDIDIWQQPDYWATPFEALAQGAGDCEDFAIAKYVSLRRLGISDERLRLIYVRARIGGPHSTLSQAHMVLGYFPTPDADPLILDNLIGDIRPGSRRPDLSPVFSFNSAGLWVSGASSSSADPTARLSRWRDLLQRMQHEGLSLEAAPPRPHSASRREN